MYICACGTHISMDAPRLLPESYKDISETRMHNLENGGDACELDKK